MTQQQLRDLGIDYPDSIDGQMHGWGTHSGQVMDRWH